MTTVCCAKCGGDILVGPALCCGCLGERQADSARAASLLRELVAAIDADREKGEGRSRIRSATDAARVFLWDRP